MTSRQRRTGPATALLLLAMTAGCSTSVPPVPDASPARLAAGEAPRLPLDGLFWSDEEYTLLHKALDILTSQCMERSKVPMPPGTAAPVSRGPRAAHRYGTLDREEAERYGYHGPPSPALAPPPALTPEQRTALAGTQNGRPGPAGTPTEGCNGWAAMQITGTTSYPVDAELLRTLDFESFDLSRRDPRTVRAIDAWASCMEAAGATHAAGPDEKPPALRGTQADAEEIRTAVADVACKEETRLVGTWAGVETAYQQDLLRRHGGEVEDIERGRRSQLSKAADTIGKTERR
ncbi:hypothetical protein [Streptomyces lavendulae]|uniref:hypothetical protein n=1 Tax=Streptomyces lavendulae TaxID=1914 RepID=UPI0024A1320B|nr:hypothetical protein Sros01_61240 [Streptomyces roseochromogenus]